MWAMRVVLCATGWALCCGHFASAANYSGPQIEVWLTSGKLLRGEIDPASNEARLVLQTSGDGITLRRPVAWERIDRATLGGRPVSAAQLRATIAAVEVQPAASRRITVRSAATPAAPVAGVNNSSGLAADPIATLMFYPYVANWDGDVETDGLVVELTPVDRHGNLAPINGLVEVELYAPHRRVALDLAPHSGGDTIELVERWTCSISAAEFTSSGLRLRLPFGAVHPEIDPNWAAWWYGIVHVKIAVPGQGVFEDSRDGVRIRPWAPTRDNLEMSTGQRFLPSEGMGRRN